MCVCVQAVSLCFLVIPPVIILLEDSLSFSIYNLHLSNTNEFVP